MAVRQSSDEDLNQRVDSRIESSCEKSFGDASCSSIKGPSNGNQDTSRDRIKSYKLSKKRMKDYQDSLSDIHDPEVSQYLNTNEEINIKRLLWEAVNKKYSEAKKQKQTTETKKRAPVKKAAKTAKTTEKVEVQKRSSKINYDALKLLEDEPVHFELYKSC